MNKYFKYSLLGLLIVAVAGVTTVGIVYAEGDPPQPHDTLADLLGFTSDELRDLMQDGTSLDELADEAGVDLDEFWQSMQDAREEYHKSRLQEALENSEISKDRYNWLMDGFENGFMGGGKSPGGYHGQGHFGNGDGTRPYGGRGGFGREGYPGNWCGMNMYNQ